MNMAKKKNKEQTLTLDDAGVLNECATSLMCAFDFAVQHRDVDAMLAVSDRWLRLYAMLSEIDEESTGKMKLGFIGDHNATSG